MRGWVKGVIGVSVGLSVLLAVPVIGIGSAFVGLSALPEQVTDLGEGVTLVPDSYVSAYIIEAGPGTFAVIDCGMSVEGNAVAAALSARGVGVDAVRAVFLTHGHGDHADGCRAFPRADVYAMQADIDLTEGRVAPPSPVGRLAGKMDSGTRVTHPLKDGDVIRVGDTDIRVYGTPGHTDGSAVYATHGVVFFGDSASATTSGTIQGAPWFFSNDQAQNVAAVAALDARFIQDAVPMRKLAFSHTGPLDGAEPLHAFAAAHR